MQVKVLCVRSYALLGFRDLLLQPQHRKHTPNPCMQLSTASTIPNHTSSFHTSTKLQPHRSSRTYHTTNHNHWLVCPPPFRCVDATTRIATACNCMPSARPLSELRRCSDSATACSPAIQHNDNLSVYLTCYESLGGNHKWVQHATPTSLCIDLACNHRTVTHLEA